MEWKTTALAVLVVMALSFASSPAYLQFLAGALPIASGNVSVFVSSTSACTGDVLARSWLFNSSRASVLLGQEGDLNLNQNQVYYLNYSVNGVPVTFYNNSGASKLCAPFQSATGELNATYIGVVMANTTIARTGTATCPAGYNAQNITASTSGLTVQCVATGVGPTGPAGPAGPAGTNGTNGVDGTNGTNGINGTNGTNGIDGINGTNGTDGINGTNASVTSGDIYILVSGGVITANLSAFNIYNNTLLIEAVNTTQNIMSLGFYNTTYLDPYLVAGGARIYWFTNKTDVAGYYNLSLTLPNVSSVEVTVPIAASKVLLGTFITPVQANNTIYQAGVRDVFLEAKLAGPAPIVAITTELLKCTGYDISTGTCSSITSIANSSSATLSGTAYTAVQMSYYLANISYLDSNDRMILNVTAVKTTGSNTDVIFSIDGTSLSRIQVPSPVGVTDISSKAGIGNCAAGYFVQNSTAGGVECASVSDAVNVSNKANLTGGNNFTGNQDVVGNITINGALDGTGGAYGDFMPANYFSVNGSDGSGGFIIGIDGKPVWDILTYPGENGKFFYMGYNHRSGDIALTVAESGRMGMNKPTNILISDSSFNGTGLNDMTVGGIYTGDLFKDFQIVAQNDSVFQYRTNLGGRGWSAYSANKTMAITPTVLEDGVTVTFGSVTGHTAGDEWYFTAFSQVPSATLEINPTAYSHVYIYNGSDYDDITHSAGTSLGIPRNILATTSYYFYVARPVQYRTTYFYLATFGAGVELKAEYWNGTAWAVVPNAYDQSINLTQSGAYSWSTGDLTGWTNSSVNGSNGYWIRYSTTGAPSTAPMLYAATPQGVDRLQVYQSAYDTIPVFSITPQGAGVFSNSIYVGYGASSTNSLSTATTAAGMYLPKKYISVDSTDNDDAGFVIGHEGLPVWDMSTFVNEDGNYLHVGINYRTAETAFTVAETGRVGVFKPSNILNYHSSFNGTGLNDMETSGTYTGQFNDDFQVRANSTSTFQWRYSVAGGAWSAWSANITMNGSMQFLYKGVYVEFPSATGYTTGDVWDFTAFSNNPAATMTVSPSRYQEVSRYNGSAYFDITDEAATTSGITFPVLNRTSNYLYVARTIPTLTGYFNLQTVGAGITLVVEYWNGTGWQALGAAEELVDGTANLTQSGAISWNTDAMPNWAVNVTVDSYTAANGFYWLRYSTTTNATTVPLAYSVSPQGFSRFSVFQNNLDTTPTFSIGANGDMTTTGTLQAKGFYGELYNSTARQLTMTTQNTYYNITGWITGELSGWTVSPENVLVCGTAGLYQVTFNMNAAVNGNDVVVYRMILNTTSEPKSETIQRYLTGQYNTVAVTFLKRFSVGDAIYWQVNDTTNNANVLSQDSKMFIVNRISN